jgi:DNA polymerase II small subunit/DNA polymerase delta subunit B
MKKPTIKQIRQQAKEKIKRMRAACVRITDDNALNAVAALNTAEDCYNIITHRYTRLQSILYFQDAFLTAGKTFFDFVEGGTT